MSGGKLDKIKGTIGNAGKGAGEMLGKATGGAKRILDVNGDGALDLKDIADVAGKATISVRDAAGVAAGKVKEATAQAGLAIEKYQDNLDVDKLRPFFRHSLLDEEFVFPKMIRIVDKDDKHKASKACVNSIGHFEDHKGLDVLYAYVEKLDQYGLSFYPNTEQGLYYRNPVDPLQYIALEDYFDYLKKMQVFELQSIAQDLGATHFKVMLSEHKRSLMYSSEKTKAGFSLPKLSLKPKNSGSVDVSLSNKSEEFSDISIASEMNCEGKEPVCPKLKYYKNDENINTLINMRMHENVMSDYKCDIQCGEKCGIKREDAVKIDAALESMKISGNASFQSICEEELRRIFRYEIEF